MKKLIEKIDSLIENIEEMRWDCDAEVYETLLDIQQQARHEHQLEIENPSAYRFGIRDYEEGWKNFPELIDATEEQEVGIVHEVARKLGCYVGECHDTIYEITEGVLRRRLGNERFEELTSWDKEAE